MVDFEIPNKLCTRRRMASRSGRFRSTICDLVKPIRIADSRMCSGKVRFGSKKDISDTVSYVRFTSESRHRHQPGECCNLPPSQITVMRSPARVRIARSSLLRPLVAMPQRSAGKRPPASTEVARSRRQVLAIGAAPTHDGAGRIGAHHRITISDRNEAIACAGPDVSSCTCC